MISAILVGSGRAQHPSHPPAPPKGEEVFCVSSVSSWLLPGKAWLSCLNVKRFYETAQYISRRILSCLLSKDVVAWLRCALKTARHQVTEINNQLGFFQENTKDRVKQLEQDRDSTTGFAIKMLGIRVAVTLRWLREQPITSDVAVWQRP